MKVLILGSTGQIGSYMVEFLLAKGYKVYCLDRRVASEKELYRYSRLKNRDSLNFTYGDIRDYARMFEIIKNINPDEIYNFAAQSHVKISFEDEFTIFNSNVVGHLNILNIVRNVNPKIKILHSSSSEMFGDVLEIPQTEVTPFNPQSPYAVGKIATHQMGVVYRRAYNMFVCNSILFNSESPRRGDNFVTRKITQAVAKIKLGKQDKLILGNLEAKRDWGHVKDKVRGIWKMMQYDVSDDYVLATNETHSIKEFLEIAFSFVNLNWQDYITIDKKFYRPAEVNLLQGNYNKAKKVLGWQPTISFESLVKEMVDNDIKQLKDNE